MKLKRIFSLALCLSLLAALLSVPALAVENALTLREDWRLTSDLDLNVPEGTTLTINGDGHYIYELGGTLQNSGLGTVTFAAGAILYPAGSSTSCTTATSNALMAERQPHIVTVGSMSNGSVTAAGSGTSKAGAATAKKGEKVTLTITPAAGYTLNTVTVTDGNGQTVAVSNNTFTMPASAVTVSAAFKQSGSGGTTPSTPVTPSTPTEPDEPDEPADDAPVVETVTSSDGTVTTTTTWSDGKQAVAVTTPAGDTTVTVTSGGGETIADVSIPSEPGEAKEFVDVNEGDWFKDAVDEATGYGLFSGTSATTFEPQTPMTRGMLAKVLHNMSGNPGYGVGDGVFDDVNDTAWYADAVDWAAKAGVVKGVSDAAYAPNQEITREQMVAMLYRYAQAIGAGSANRDTLANFPDGDTVSNYAKDAMQWAVAEGLILGRGSSIAPQGTATRAEVAAVLTRFTAYLTK